MPEWFLRSIRIVCLSGAVLCLLYLCVSQLFPLTPATRFSLFYNLPLFSAFFFWLYCRLRENTKISVTGIVLDALIVCVAGSRFVRAVIPPSGHALFLSYSLLTTSNRLYRIIAAILLALTIALKLSWGDYSSWLYGILIGVVFAAIRKIIRI